MTSRIAVLCIDAVDMRLVADFWAAVLGWRVVDEDTDIICLAPTDRSWPTLDICAVPEAKTVKNRLHLDLRADGSSTEEEIARVIALGATRVEVGQSPDSTWTVLADPEGNEFCILARTVQEVQ